mmetsp:Transcript_10433/g.10476  ORF Transcript_10433/g.10476 Transcript_10433/m.10476 type:complete len:190 (-) Transcript_10433:1090-1659(-)
MRKEVPEKDRRPFYQDMSSGKKFSEPQFKKIPLNSDANLGICNTRDKQQRVHDQDENVRAGQKVKDEIVERMLEDLNNVEEDPLTSDQLEVLFHSRGVSMRHLGKLCTFAQLNHQRKMGVIEVIARCAKVLIRDGLTFLADDEEAGFKKDNIHKCVLHYILEIFNSDEYRQTAIHNIWDFISDHAKKKY